MVQYKKQILIIGILLIVLGVSWYTGNYYFAQKKVACFTTGNYSGARITINNINIPVAIAETEAAHAKGLSGTNKMTEAGMLFVFPHEIVPAFWMKDMRYAIDIVWIDSLGVVSEVTQQIAPESYPKTYTPTHSVRYVLELPAGDAALLGITSGSRMENIDKLAECFSQK